MTDFLKLFGIALTIAVFLMLIWAVVMIVIINIGYGQNMTAEENTLLAFCQNYNLETAECYQIYGDIESPYQPPQ